MEKDRWKAYNCPKFQGLQLPEGLTRIGENAFYWCLNLVSIIVLPESLKEIEERAFYYCPSITKVVIPRGVKCIGLAAFSWCISLTDVQYTGTVDEWNKLYRYSDLNEYRVPFYKCPLEFVHCLDGNVRLPDFARSERKSFLIDIFNSNIRSFSVPYGTNTIPEHAFTLCTKLESVEFPDTLEYIKEFAFWECISLKEIVLPDNVKKLDGFAFFHCTSLESVSIPSAMSLNSCAFMECRNLKKIVFRGTLEEWEKKTIGRHAVDWWNKDFFPHNVPVYCDDGLTSLEIYLCPNADANLLNFFVPIGGYPAAIYLRFPDLSDLVKNIVEWG